MKVIRGPKKTVIQLFNGRSDRLLWDPERYKWDGEVPFMEFTAKLGRKLLGKKHQFPSVIEMKWVRILPPTYKFKWLSVWDADQAQKKASLI